MRVDVSTAIEIDRKDLAALKRVLEHAEGEA